MVEGTAKICPPPPLGSSLLESSASLGQGVTSRIGSTWVALWSASPLGGTRWSILTIFSYGSGVSTLGVCET